MKRTFLALSLLLASTLGALEGKWTPQQVLELDPKWLAAEGLELPPTRLWDPRSGIGLLSAAINISGCSAGWISADGLFITNHHCLFPLIQEHSTPERDLITSGYLARTREQELRGKTSRVTIPRRFTDVTAQILAAVPKNATDSQRHRAIERKQNEIVAACEKVANARCRVAAHDGGVQYVLQEMDELADVRLVYAPPRAIGEYGGEIDNWMWPRHTGDFAIARVYQNGKPFRPDFYFPLSREGAKPGDFVMVLGYPGGTYRALTAPEMEERLLYFTTRANVYREWIALLESSTKGSAEGEIAVASVVKSLANRQKNAEGQLEGFRRGNILAKERAGDETVLAWARENKQHAGAVAAWEGLEKLAAEKKAAFERDFFFDHIRMSAAAGPTVAPKGLAFAIAVARGAGERQKPDADRDAAYQERNFKRVLQRVEAEQKSWFAPADKAQLAAIVMRALALPKDSRIESIDTLFSGATSEAQVRAKIDELYSGTKIFDVAERMKMMNESPAQLQARRDPLVDLGFALDRELRDVVERKDRWEGTISRLRPEWRRAVIAHAGAPVAYDANSTLRVSFAHVQGYAPRDGVWYTPQTSLSGVVAKHTGEEPFDVPDPVLRAAGALASGADPAGVRWRDEKLGDVPVCFLSDGDTTGGNSGSPTVNGRGELVGINFDRVWENISNDFSYNQNVNRNINVDVRYVLWILDRVEHADELLRELGVTPQQQ